MNTKNHDPLAPDALNRRALLKAGFLTLGGLTLPQILRARDQAAAQGSSMRGTSVIFVELAGGPTHFETYDPKPALRKVSCPALVLNGEKDLQVPHKENLPAIEAALKEAGNSDYTIKMLPGLNHLFQRSSTGAVSEYAKIPETINPAALNAISDWLLERFK